jgi:hypothetical protein
MDGTVSTSAELWPQRFDAAVVLVKHIFYCGLYGWKNVWQNCFWKKILCQKHRNSKIKELGTLA